MTAPGYPPDDPSTPRYPVVPGAPVYGSQPAPYPTYPPPPAYVPAQMMPQVSQTITSGGLPTWMHLCYALLGWIPCFAGWIIWPIHWWFSKSRANATTVTQTMYYPPR